MSRECAINNLRERRATLQGQQFVLKKQQDDENKLLDDECRLHYQEYLRIEANLREEFKLKCKPLEVEKLTLQNKEIVLDNSINRIQATIKNSILNILYDFFHVMDIIELIDIYANCYCLKHDKHWLLDIKLCCHNLTFDEFYYEIKGDWKEEQIKKFQEAEIPYNVKIQYPLHSDDINFLYDLWNSGITQIKKDGKGVLYWELGYIKIEKFACFKISHQGRIYVREKSKYQFCRVFV